MRLISAIGWLGAVAILAGYGLVSSRALQPDSYRYQLINIAGSVGLMVNCYASGALPAAALNLLWMIIGAVVIVRRLRNPQHRLDHRT